MAFKANEVVTMTVLLHTLQSHLEVALFLKLTIESAVGKIQIVL